jgi:hypothetical protein
MKKKVIKIACKVFDEMGDRKKKCVENMSSKFGRNKT